MAFAVALPALFLGAAVAMVAPGASAQIEPLEAPAASEQLEQQLPPELTGTLRKVQATGVVTLAFRTTSIPFSFAVARGEPIGYSIDICRRLVEAIGEALGRDLTIRWLSVTAADRIDAILSGRADLECGSTTSSAERRAQVAFSPTIFVSGTKLLVKRSSPIRSFRDLDGRTVVVTAGTTNERAIRDLARQFKLDIRLIVAGDHDESYAKLVDGSADAFATDEVLLYGLIAQRHAQAGMHVVGEFLSYELYGIMYRRNDALLAQLIDATFQQLVAEGEFDRLYKRWFLEPLPSGATLGLPMNAELDTLLRTLAPEPQ